MTLMATPFRPSGPESLPTAYTEDLTPPRRREAAASRHFTVHTDQVTSTDGTCEVAGVLDLADALDLETAVREEAAVLKDLGNTQPLDVRRSQAIGVIARRDLTLDYDTDTDTNTATDESVDSGSEEADGEPVAPSSRTKRRADRRVVLTLHLTEAALTGADTVGRCGNTRTPVLVEQLRQWCGTAGQITVRPVRDLADHTPVDSYETPDRHREQVELRDHHCVFPWCTRPAERCDLDHVVAHPRGPTCPCNLAPLCRRHHRHKTHGHWTYTTLDPGTYLWASPHGYRYLVDHTGTQPVTSPATGEP